MIQGNPQQTSPLQQIIQMRQQNLTNNQVIQNLQRQGFSNNQIFEAMNQADTKTAVETLPSEFRNIPTIENPMPQPRELGPQRIDYGGEDRENTEELIEAIIDEKWNDLIKDVNKMIEWKNRAESRIANMEMKIKNLKENFDQLHQAVIGKVSEYDNHILDVGTELKAMEKVFSKVLPEFTENVHELSRISDKMKRTGER